MNRIRIAAVVASLAGAMLLSGTCANAQSASAEVKLAQAAPQDPTVPRYRRAPRLRVTPYEEQGVVPHYNPGPNAVRVCNAHYEQEYRPSGTVIVPKMHCVWTNDPRARAVAD